MKRSRRGKEVSPTIQLYIVAEKENRLIIQSFMRGITGFTLFTCRHGYPYHLKWGIWPEERLPDELKK
jgi:hypothetical protein